MESILTLISGSHDDKNNQPSPYRPLHLTDVHGVLMSEPKSATCIRLAEVTGISHDSTLDKPYSKHMDLVGHF